MKSVLKPAVVAIAAFTCAAGMLTRPAAADSTADLVLNLSCQGGYHIEVWRNRTTKGLTYRSTSPSGNLVSYQGLSKKTEGTTVYKFFNGNYQYWVWDGTLDSPNAGTLEVYKSDRLIMRRQCKKL